MWLCKYHYRKKWMNNAGWDLTTLVYFKPFKEHQTRNYLVLERKTIKPFYHEFDNNIAL